MIVELIYDRDCPNVLAARANLVAALTASGREARWTEWDRNDLESPPHVRGYGSPTILVDGKDVAGSAAGAEGPTCRLYRSGSGRLDGVPSVELIAEALGSSDKASAIPTRASADWRSSIGAVPGIAFAFLPNLACPACWPAYAALLSSVGLGFLLDEAFLLPLTAVFLLLTVGVLAFRARTRHGYGPFALGLLGAIVVLAGKFAIESNAVMYGGIAGLVSASVWNAWPTRVKRPGCPACASDSSVIAPSTLD